MHYNYIGTDMNLLKYKLIVCSFINKLTLYKE